MKKTITLVVFCALFAVCVLPAVAFAESVPSVTAKEAVLATENGEILFEKNSTEKRPIASMTKIMTLLCLYEGIESGKISLDDTVTVSARAASMGGSQVFLETNATYTAENLIKSIIVCSANDSCVAMAEHLCGSVENFVDRMNEKSAELGLVATHFENCTGLPHVSQFSCARDVAVMFANLIKYPHYFQCSSVWMEDFQHPQGRVTGMTNTNKLVRFYQGCDGGKTGFTNEAMHCLAATAKRGDTRVIAVVVGAPSSKVRFGEVSGMFDYAFANYQNKVYVNANEVLQSAKVAGGKTEVEGVVGKPLCAFGKKGENNCSVEVTVEELHAPIKCGEKIGMVRLLDGEKVVEQVDLVAKNDVEKKSFWDYVKEIAG